VTVKTQFFMVAADIYGGAWYLWILSIELAYFHPSGA
jgi:hypothetical protein